MEGSYLTTIKTLIKRLTANVTLTDEMLNIKIGNKPRIPMITSITQHYFRVSG